MRTLRVLKECVPPAEVNQWNVAQAKVAAA
jgi:hypothetical protein